MRLERRMAGLVQEDDRLLEEIRGLRAKMLASEDGLHKVRRWARALVAEAGIIRCNARRKRLAEEWRRCSILADDIRFGLRLRRSPRNRQRG